MKPKVQAIAKRFAEYLVGAMLQRSGAEFLVVETGHAGSADFLVRDGDRYLAIHVRHTTDPKVASKIWEKWLEGPAVSAPGLADTQTSKEAADDIYEPHLVIVTGAGEYVFADGATAPFLAPDDRTSLSMLAPSSIVRKRA
ncbi:hypothetical protein INH39_25785 [Massilia violaceinigra]|uniref:Uncharacterized protein n=1 Tax=Massilia violaceinigra TaxID=2045208 RepID=A0ABY4A884_9BURK|nr:hypothetical protein [Massilia violaceinigra]UOD28823.1 hypothetical protein INH39_25785 [Massilia violaceinigra]